MNDIRIYNDDVLTLCIRYEIHSKEYIETIVDSMEKS